MKLLFDENLSPSLVRLLADCFPGSTHVLSLTPSGTPDPLVWTIARDHGFVIVPKDNDFRQRSFLSGAPPQVVWLSVGNAATAAIATLIRQRHADFLRFERDSAASLLVVDASA